MAAVPQGIIRHSAGLVFIPAGVPYPPRQVSWWGSPLSRQPPDIRVTMTIPEPQAVQIKNGTVEKTKVYVGMDQSKAYVEGATTIHGRQLLQRDKSYTQSGRGC
ncbi:hypothetical protein PoB_003829800 [Plakobranchus ocellatus]|uniref:Uncharacterized protein n=1 Tax=Plakobranchus ocellatus TaxID=259542 RepID=A0AAV4AY63_9GAST|nr:hypothetical protein PoB_003829800 [Plakobranchus ocellatus]